MRRGKIDKNQPEIVALFRELGARVYVSSDCGDGMTDLIVQFHDSATRTYNLRTYLVEIKDGSISKSRRQLTPAQEVFHSIFHCHIVECRADVFDLLGMTDPDGVNAE